MRSLKRDYNRVTKENDGWAPLLCFSVAVRGKGYSDDSIMRWFHRLIDPEEYQNSIEDKKAWLAHMGVDAKKVLRNTENG